MDSPLNTAQFVRVGQMQQMIENAFEWLFRIVNSEADHHTCRYVVAQCMGQRNSENIFDTTAKLIFSDNGLKSRHFEYCVLKTFTDFTYCICGPQRQSSRETVAKLSTTKTLEILMIGIYVCLTRLEERDIPSHGAETMEQIVFKAMHTVVEIISAEPRTMSTGIVHTSTTTRDPAILTFFRNGIVGHAPMQSQHCAQLIRYYEGKYDKKREMYTTMETTDWQTECQLVVPENVQLIHHNVTFIDLHFLVNKVQKSAPPTVLAIAERLMELVKQTWT